MTHFASSNDVEQIETALSASASMIDFVISCNDTTAEGMLALHNAVQHVGGLLQQAQDSAAPIELQQFEEAKARGESFIEAHARSNQ
jgi:ABC-type xylose transport system substrate-binding protein